MIVNKKWYIDLLIAVIISEIIWYFIDGGIVGILIGLVDGGLLLFGVIGVHNLIMQIGEKILNIWDILISIDISVLFPSMIITGFGSDEDLQNVSFIIVIITTIILLLLTISGHIIEKRTKK